MVRARQQAESDSMESGLTKSGGLDVMWTSPDHMINRVDTIYWLFQATYGERNDLLITWWSSAPRQADCID